jgi:hypothetical protein
MLAEKAIKMATDRHVSRVAPVDDMSQSTDDLSLESVPG